ncbi:MAG: cytochrome c oxidase subunit 3 family protein [Clostridia bacterium]|nr:cytochrome c oxidase subunit 3 family protein [Deltaproteobacteria bacterium]
MSTAAAHEPNDPEHDHDPNLAHHFDTPQQQFDSGKLGIWLFLIQEILFFSGLFCAYAVYRSNHPEVFEFAHRYLDWKLGGINTIVLLCSSLSAAWAVRSAQLGDKKWLVFNICFTICCAFGFLGIKYVEYAHKFHDGLLWGRNYDPHHPPETHGEEHAAVHSNEAAISKPAEAIGSRDQHAAASDTGDDHNTPVGPTPSSGPHAAETGKAGATAPNAAPSDGAAADARGGPHEKVESPRNTSVFFSIYFAMTGLHGIHVIAGIVVYVWLLIRALKGEFGPKHFAAIDFAALYWHLVDLVWIYLFPLLYLIR